MCDRFLISLSRTALVVVFALVLGAAPAVVVALQPDKAAAQCRPAGPLVQVPELPEASGLAMSRRVPGRLWAHNDSGEPVLVALDGKGQVTGRLRLSGAEVEDWEAIAVGPCPAGSCIYVADIGDNDAERERITVYRVAEPAAATESAPVSEVFHATYPDGRHDAEALLIAPDGRLYIVTKGEGGPVALYRFPREARPEISVQLERVGEPRDAGKTASDNRITDGAVSADGERVVLRSNRGLTFYRAADLLAGNWRDTGRVDLAQLGEPQGEGVAFGTGDTIYLSGEGGGKSRPGTFAIVTCTSAP